MVVWCSMVCYRFEENAEMDSVHEKQHEKWKESLHIQNPISLKHNKNISDLSVCLNFSSSKKKQRKMFFAVRLDRTL